MDSPHAANDGIFKTCGIQIPLGENDMPDKVRVVHCLPKGFNYILKEHGGEGMGNVTVRVGGKQLYAHKEILRARIPFFEALFNANMVECTSGEVDMSTTFDGFAFSTIERLLEYARSGQITISVKNVQELMMGAIYLQMESVVEECAQFVRKRVSIENALAIFLFCNWIAYHEIDEFLLTFIDKNFVPISRTPEFHELPVDVMATLVKRDSLRVDTEQQVFEAVDRWIEGRVDGKEHAARLLKLVRCIHLPMAFITDVIENKEWTANNLECISLLDDAKGYILNGEKGSVLSSPATSRRFCEQAHRLIFSIGFEIDYRKGFIKSILEIYNPITNIWSQCATRGQQTMGFTNAVAVNENIYFFGGLYSDCELLDTVTNEWRKMPFLTSDRTKMAAGVINGKIYVAGGNDEMNSLSTVETYDPSEQVPAWTPLKSMETARTAAGFCVLNDKLYVIGGIVPHQSRYLSEGEVFDPETNSWSPIAPMTQRRGCLGVAAFNGKIYAVGGYDETNLLDIVERYDPVTNTWTTLNSLKTARSYHTLVVACGKLFMLGGDDYFTIRRNKNYLTSVEMYNEETDSWEEKAGMMGKFRDICVGTLSLPASFPTPATSLEPPFAPARASGFGSFHLKDELRKAISDCGFQYPSEIQHECNPRVIRGMNVNCQAKSGMGKTTIFIIGTLEQLEPVDGEVSVLVLCNTHELAYKISKQYEQFMKHLPSVKISVFCGDVSSKKNIAALNANCPHIVIGTPGRVKFLANSGELKLDRVKHLVIDDYEKILKTSGMLNDVENIVTYIPDEKQVLIFSKNLLDGQSFPKF